MTVKDVEDGNRRLRRQKISLKISLHQDIQETNRCIACKSRPAKGLNNVSLGTMVGSQIKENKSLATEQDSQEDQQIQESSGRADFQGRPGETSEIENNTSEVGEGVGYIDDEAELFEHGLKEFESVMRIHGDEILQEMLRAEETEGFLDFDISRPALGA